MAQFLGFATMNAANFDADGVPAGHVLTADGNGGAEWRPTPPGLAEMVELKKYYA